MNYRLNQCNIIVPVDFSGYCRRAFPVAQEIARLFDGKITPFHAYDLYSDLDGFHYLNGDMRLHGEPLSIQKELRSALTSFTGGSVDQAYLADCLVEEDNDAPDAIVKASGQFDLVVMSSHGRKGFSRLLLGSVAEKVLRLTHRPVIIVEDEADLCPIRKILVTTDFSQSSYAAFPYAQEVALAAGAEVHLFHSIANEHLNAEQIENIRSECLEKLQDVAERYMPAICDKINCFAVHGSDSAHHAIREHLTEQHYDLLVMATVGKTGLSHLLGMGSTTATLVRAVKTTIMAVKPDSQA